MDIITYFDTKNHNHIIAFSNLTKKGVWPKEFYDTLVAENIDLPNGWQVGLMAKLASEYIEKLKENIPTHKQVEVTGIKWDSEIANNLFPDVILFVPIELNGDELVEYVENKLFNEYGSAHDGWESLEILN